MGSQGIRQMAYYQRTPPLPAGILKEYIQPGRRPNFDFEKGSSGRHRAVEKESAGLVSFFRFLRTSLVCGAALGERIFGVFLIFWLCDGRLIYKPPTI